MPRPTRKRSRRPLRPYKPNDSAASRGTYTQSYLKENNIARFPKNVVCTVPRSSGPFPDVYKNTMKTSVESLMNGGVIVSNTYVINGPANLFGPQTNFAGAFAANYPSGINWLLATNNVLGSNAPYRFLTVQAYKFEVQLQNTSTVGARVCIWPSLDASFLAMPFSNMCEQKGAICIDVSPNSLGGPFRGRIEGKCHELFGVTQQQYHDDSDYVQIVGATPTRPCFLHVVSTSLDGTNISTYAQITAYLDCTFTGLNQMPTTGPS